jgi:hypothetical protein
VTSGCPVTATTPAWPLQGLSPRCGRGSRRDRLWRRQGPHRNRAGVHCADRRRAGWRRDRLGPIPLRPPCRRDTLAAAVCAALPHGRPSEPGVAGRRRADLTPNAPVLGPTSFSPLLPSRSSLSHRHETGSTRLHAGLRQRPLVVPHLRRGPGRSTTSRRGRQERPVVDGAVRQALTSAHRMVAAAGTTRVLRGRRV